MDNELFMNTELPPTPEMAVHFEPPSSSSAMMLNWALMDPNLARNSSLSPQDCFLWEKSTEQQHQQQQSIFDSALSSLVSSPTPSNSNFSGGGGGGDGFMIRELIGKLGNIGNNISGEIYGMSNNGKMSRSASCYETPMSSPPPANANSQIMMNRTTALTEFSADPGFAERAAKFSCFGSRSFNGRTNSGVPINNGNMVSSGKLTRVSSTPSLKALVSPEIAAASSRPMIPGGEFPRKRKSLSKGKSKENPLSTASPSPTFSKTAEKKEDWDGKGSKSSGEKGGKRRREEEDQEEEDEQGGQGNKINNTKPPEPPKDYIHVRARRGQATDSHSLAERVRREKIGERMKLLQDLVPGCNKVTGKALMLDEIINYVQSLQRQVEFLSMKLSSVNDTRLEFNVDALMSKDVMIPSSSNRLHEEGLQTKSSSHHQQLNNNYNDNSQLHPNISSSNMMLQSPMNFTHLPTTLNQFTDSLSQYQMFSEEDLQSIVGMGVAQNPNHESQHMKIEL